MSKPVIPVVPPSASTQGRTLFDSSVKETLELLTGRRGDGIRALSVDASTSEIIEKINEIIERLQG
jgi:hypothetical protein